MISELFSSKYIVLHIAGHATLLLVPVLLIVVQLYR